MWVESPFFRGQVEKRKIELRLWLPFLSVESWNQINSLWGRISSVWAYLCVAGRIYGSGTELFLCDLGYCCVGTIYLLVGWHILTVDRVLSKRKALHWWLLSPSRFGWVDCWGQIYKEGAEFLCAERVLCEKHYVVSVCGRFGCKEVCCSLIYQSLHTNFILQVCLFIYSCCTLYLLHRQHIYLTHRTNLSPLFAVIVYVQDKYIIVAHNSSVISCWHTLLCIFS